MKGGPPYGGRFSSHGDVMGLRTADIMRRKNPSTKEDILNFCREYMRENRYAPTIREIGDGLNIRSSSTVHSYLQELKKEGKIIGRSNASRAFRLADDDYILKNP